MTAEKERSCTVENKQISLTTGAVNKSAECFRASAVILSSIAGKYEMWSKYC